MSKALKISLLGAAAFVGLLVLVALAAVFFVDVNAYKSRVEIIASDALGMEVKIGGALGMGFFPGLHVTMQDAHVRNRGSDVVAVQQARVEIDLLRLFRREIRFGNVDLVHPVISIVRGTDGILNIETVRRAGTTLPVLESARLSLSDATFSYADHRSGGGFVAEGCSLDLPRLLLPGGEGRDLLKRVGFSAQAACRQIRSPNFAVSDLRFSLAGKDGVLDFKPVTMRIFGGQASANIRVDLSGAIPLYRVDYSLPQFRIEEFLKTLSPKKFAQGPMDFSAKLTMQGTSPDEMVRTSDGAISLRGGDLTLDGRDLDRELSSYESSQHFNLVDVAALFFAGPIGLAVTKGYNFATIFEGSGGSTTIRTLVSDWKVEHGVAQAQNAAMATNEHRIALKGNLDFVNGRFDDVTVALIGTKGCTKVRQKISGPFSKPVVEQPNVLTALAGPVLKLLKKGRKLLSGGQCEVFYTGSVAAPK